MFIEEPQNYPWKFQRIGGFDQVILENAEDIIHLRELDPKLWVALSCPASGLEFDAKTLSLLDEDRDGRIRIPEVLDAIDWMKKHLKSLDTIIDCHDKLYLSLINTDVESGKRLHTTAKAILKNIHKTDKQYITINDLNESNILNSNHLYNGDGIVPATDKLEEDLKLFINDALKVIGGIKDASGLDGINIDIAKAFIQSLQEWKNWNGQVSSATTPLGDDTAEAWLLMQELKNKINDYFLRTELASYAPQAETSLNVDEKYIVPTDNGLLQDEMLAELPLSKIEADKPLELDKGLNPVWRDKVIQFVNLIKPFLTSENQLTRTDWHNIQTILSPYSQAVLSKPALVKVEVTIAPTITIDKLGEKRITEILNSNLYQRLEILAEKDSKTPAASSDVAAVERLVIYHQHLYRLLMNFVSFKDFFIPDYPAAFQAGKLFIDGRCCTLCVPVTDIAKHTILASYSELFLMYCECMHKNISINGTQEKRTIVAAMTAGDADFLLEGRNGVFIDNKGHDWDAKVIKIVAKPISLNQAIWDPYKRMGRFITEQFNKWASTKDTELTTSGNQVLQDLTKTVNSSTNKFDIGKSVGIFAAIGLAIGAIGTALASIAQSLFSLQWWQFPLVILALFLLISGPSVVLAWLKLRQRTLAPLLEASGWAINGRIKINFYLGSKLTSKAQLPKNSNRTIFDPMKKLTYKYWITFFIALVIGISATGGWLWYSGYFSKTQNTQIKSEPQVVTQPEKIENNINNSE